MKNLSLKRALVWRVWCALLLVACFTTSGAHVSIYAQSPRLSARGARVDYARGDFARFVVVGDSLSAGYQNNSLLDRQQVNGYASLVARQAKADLVLPLIAEPGVPNVLQLISPGPPPIVAPVAGQSPGRINPTQQPFNLAVPGARTTDVLNARPNLPVDSLTDLVLGFPDLLVGRSRTQLEIAESLQPTLVFLWIGNNDALGAALAANPALLTSQASFERDFKQIIDRLAATNAKLVVANIPDVTVVPALTPAEQILALYGQRIEAVGARLGLAKGDYVTTGAIPLIAAALSGANTPVLPGNVVLTAAEANQIRAAVEGFNATIRREAEAKGAALANVNALLNLVDRFGYPVLLRDGNKANLKFLTTEFLGGLFSLDGVHPTNTGYAIVANEFIRAYDVRFRRLLPFVDVSRIASQDPLVFR